MQWLRRLRLKRGREQQNAASRIEKGSQPFAKAFGVNVERSSLWIAGFI
jgi:hypothetical protein